MEHWNEVLPEGFMTTVVYEDVVADTEKEARRLIEFLGLPWNDKCVDFHKSDRPVKTASVAQVRKPIYKTSVKRWKKYGEGLQPLVDAVVDFLPSPLDIPPARGLDPNNAETAVEVPSDDNAKFCSLAFKLWTDPYVGKLVFFRVYSGQLKKGDTIYNPRTRKRERVSRVMMIQARNPRRPTPEARFTPFERVSNPATDSRSRSWAPSRAVWCPRPWRSRAPRSAGSRSQSCDRRRRWPR
jgi:hypothetical protein